MEQSPVRAGLAEGAEQWPWSSARSHLGLAGTAFLDLTRWARRFDPPCWKRVLDLALEEAGLLERFRESTLSGRPLGDPEFVERLEREYRVRPVGRRPGRPRKRQAPGCKLETMGA
ncbi:MAG: hypothetical protein ACKV22_03510 [Bryobacteraceae bacterium]